MRIGLEFENQVYNGISIHPMLMVRLVFKLPISPPLIHEIFVGGTTERWEDPFFRKCFENILNGTWRDHDPYALEGRLNAGNSLYGRENQSSIFRTFQGWLAMR
jgi:hypothetical protein